MKISDYKGREQTYLKHRVLEEYLTAWGIKLGSAARKKRVRLWYIDCFAGPWSSTDQASADTSVAIGLEALNKAATTWQAKQCEIDVAAIFVEKNPKSYARLVELVDTVKGQVHAHTMQGEFGEHVPHINKLIADDAALVFVDPTGWKGAAMRNVQPLVKERFRDVIVNLMFNFINRFKDDQRDFLREQLRDFFGLVEAQIPTGLDEDGLLNLYRQQLKEKCGVTFAADLAIPHPTQDRTWFRLVVGGKHREILSLFRDIERKVIGREAVEVRDRAKRERRESRTAQIELGLAPSSSTDDRYEDLHARGCTEAKQTALDAISDGGERPYMMVWPSMLERHHITLSDAGHAVMDLHREGRLVVGGLKPRQRLPHDTLMVRRPKP